MANNLAEYLVSLGIKVDDEGFRKVQNTLFTTKATILGITAGLAALTAGVAKASLSLVEATQKYEDMAKAGKKSAAAIAQQEIALKAMGKTLQEVNRNDRLKKTYKELKGIGKEIGLPKAGEGRTQIDRMLVEFQRLKMASGYVLQWINNEFLNRIALPLYELRKNLEEMRKKITENLPKLSMTIGGFIGNFMRLMLAGVNGVKDLVTWVKDLPDVVHKTLLAFGGLWAVMKASPVFWLLGGLMSLLLLLDDYQAYKRKENSYFGDTLWSGLEDGTFGDKLGGLFDDAIEKLKAKLTEWLDMGAEISQALVDGIFGHDFKNDGVKVGGFVNKLITFISEFLQDENLLRIADNVITSLQGVIKGIFDGLGAAFDTIEWDALGASVGKFIEKLFGKITETIGKLSGNKDDNLLKSAIGALTSLANGIGKAIVAALSAIQWADVVTDVAGLLTTMVGNLVAILSPESENESIFSSVNTTMSGLGKGLGKAIVSIVKAIPWSSLGTSAADLINAIVKSLIDFITPEAGEENIVTIIGDSLIGVANGVVSALLSAMSKVNFGYLGGEAFTAVKNILHSLFAVIFGGRVVIGEGNIKEYAGIGETATNLMKPLLKTLINAISDIPWAEMGADVADMFNELFAGIFGLIDTTTGEGNIFALVADSAVGLAQGIVKALLSAIKGIKWGELSGGAADAVSNILNSLFEIVFGAAEKRDVRGRVVKKESSGIAGAATEIIRSLFDSIAYAAGKVDWNAIGTTVGDLFGKLIEGIGNFAKRESKSGGNVFGSVLGAGLAIVDGLLDAIGAALRAVTPDDVADALTNMLSGLWKMIYGAFSKETGEGEDIKSTGQKIGEVIINAIEFVGSVIEKLIENIRVSLEDGSTQKELMLLGSEIGQLIADGLYGTLDGILQLLGIPVEKMRGENQNPKFELYADEAGNVFDFKDAAQLWPDPEKLASAKERGDVLAQEIHEKNQSLGLQVDEFSSESLGGTPRYYGERNWLGQPKDTEEYSKFMQAMKLREDALKTQDLAGFVRHTGNIAQYQSARQQGDVGNAMLYLDASINPKVFDKSVDKAAEKAEPEVDTAANEEFLIESVNEIVERINEEPPTLKFYAEIGNIEEDEEEGEEGGNAFGGRYNRFARTTISEGNQVEYVIPMNNPERAKGLILQMLSEMGSGARGILDSFGVRDRSGGFGGIDTRLAMAGAYPMGGGSVKSNSDNVVTSNPVINVYGSSDPALTGKVAYQASENVLIRHIRGVFGQ